MGRAPTCDARGRFAFRVGHRQAGLGSLGRQRFTAVVDDWHGGVLAREAKALAPSAWRWWTERADECLVPLHDDRRTRRSLARSAGVRVRVEQRWVVRRLAPDSGRVKLASLPKAGHLEDDLLRAMGHETANVHVPLGNVKQRLRADGRMDPDWLYHAAGAMADSVLQDSRPSVTLGSSGYSTTRSDLTAATSGRTEARPAHQAGCRPRSGAFRISEAARSAAPPLRSIVVLIPQDGLLDRIESRARLHSPQIGRPASPNASSSASAEG